MSLMFLASVSSIVSGQRFGQVNWFVNLAGVLSDTIIDKIVDVATVRIFIMFRSFSLCFLFAAPM